MSLKSIFEKHFMKVILVVSMCFFCSAIMLVASFIGFNSMIGDCYDIQGIPYYGNYSYVPCLNCRTDEFIINNETIKVYRVNNKSVLGSEDYDILNYSVCEYNDILVPRGFFYDD